MIATAGPVPVQLRFATGLTSEQYVTRQAWREASLPCCPAHPEGDCDFGPHGTYDRVHPPGTKIARSYCPQAHCTFSLLPDHLAARFPGTLEEIEQVVTEVEQEGNLTAVADRVRRDDDITPTSTILWARRRVCLVHALLAILISLLPQRFHGCAPTLHAFRLRLACAQVLVPLRDIAHAHLYELPRPLGFDRTPAVNGEQKTAEQHHTGPAPPPHRA